MKRFIIYFFLTLVMYRVLFCDTIVRIDHKIFWNYCASQTYAIFSIVNPIYKYKYDDKVEKYIAAHSDLIKNHKTTERISDDCFIGFKGKKITLIDVKKDEYINDNTLLFYKYKCIFLNKCNFIDTINGVMYFRYDDNIDSIVGYCM